MKKYISIFFIATLLFTMFAGIGSTALAVNNVTISIDPNSVDASAGQVINLTATIGTDIDLTDYQVVCMSNSQTYGGCAPLLTGDPGTIAISLTVTQGMIGNDVPFKVQYKTESSTDWEDGGTDNVAINALSVVIAVTATASPTLVSPDDIVTFTFNIENQGEAQLDNITVKAAELKNGQALNAPFSLAAGSAPHAVTYQYTVTSTTGVTVHPVVTYTANGATQTKNDIAPIELTPALRKVEPTLTVDNSKPNVGEEVTFTLTITNNGNVPYTNMKVTWNGQPMSFPTTKLNPGDSPSKTYKMSFQTSADVKFTITMNDQKGDLKSISTSTVSILLPIDPNALKQNIGLVIKVDKQQLTSAGTVTFSGYVSNASEYTLSDVAVTDPTLGTIFSVSEMAPNTKQSISNKTVDIDNTTTYNFTLTVKDRNGQQYTIIADPITVTIQSAQPTPTDYTQGAANVTDNILTPGNNASDPLLVWFIVAGVILVLIIGVGIALIVLWRNGRSPSKVSAARSSVPRNRAPFRNSTGKSKSGGFRDRNNF